jgi:hypothetical protein
MNESFKDKYKHQNKEKANRWARKPTIEASWENRDNHASPIPSDNPSDKD